MPGEGPPACGRLPHDIYRWLLPSSCKATHPIRSGLYLQPHSTIGTSSEPRPQQHQGLLWIHCAQRRLRKAPCLPTPGGQHLVDSPWTQASAAHASPSSTPKTLHCKLPVLLSPHWLRGDLAPLPSPVPGLCLQSISCGSCHVAEVPPGKVPLGWASRNSSLSPGGRGRGGGSSRAWAPPEGSGCGWARSQAPPEGSSHGWARSQAPFQARGSPTSPHLLTVLSHHLLHGEKLSPC